MKLLILVSCLISTQLLAQSTGYEMRINLFQDGKIVASPNVIVQENQKAVMTQTLNKKSEIYFEVLGQETKTRDIMLKITVGELAKNGKKTTLAKYHKLTKENVDTELPFEDQNKKVSRYSMRILVLRKAMDLSNKAPEAGPMLISF